jgi:hypothetical protein
MTDENPLLVEAGPETDSATCQAADAAKGGL